jgi:hypothetical protein
MMNLSCHQFLFIFPWSERIHSQLQKGSAIWKNTKWKRRVSASWLDPTQHAFYYRIVLQSRENDDITPIQGEKRLPTVIRKCSLFFPHFPTSNYFMVWLITQQFLFAPNTDCESYNWNNEKWIQKESSITITGELFSNGSSISAFTKNTSDYERRQTVNGHMIRHFDGFLVSDKINFRCVSLLSYHK